MAPSSFPCGRSGSRAGAGWSARQFEVRDDDAGPWNQIMGVLAEGIGEPAHTGELVRRLREVTGMSVEQVAAGAGVTSERLQALEAGQGVTELGYDDVCALVRATQPPRPTWWSDGFEHDLTVARLAPPATPKGRRYWSRVAEVREQLERIGSGGPG